jgi:monovalent cation/hydrogen antiporter
MFGIELILALLVAVCVLVLVASGLHVPYPIFLVVGGLVLALLPFVPDVELAPELVFVLFLPPLLYIAAFDTSIRDVRAQLPSILSLAVGLVLATTAMVAVVTHAIAPEFGWPLAFALGAIVSPPDAVAAKALLRGLGVPRRVVTLLESESLFNDASALVTYQAALAAAATAAFSPVDAGVDFVVKGLGGIAVGVLVGVAVVQLRARLREPAVEITIGLLTPWAAYLPAEHLNVSGVLAAVSAGLCVGWAAPRIMDSETRVRARAVWDMVTFILNSLVFILIGMQLSTILRETSSQSLAALAVLAGVVSLVVIVVRLVWVFSGWAVRKLIARASEQAQHAAADARQTFVLGWAGMRGVVSLATALALPLSLEGRNPAVFVTFGVILVTLVGQGMTLPIIIRRLHVGLEDVPEGREDELRARSVAAEAALTRIDELAEEWPDHLPLIDELRTLYEHRTTHLTELVRPANGSADAAEQEMIEHQKIRRAVIDAERAAVLDMRNQGTIDDQAWRKLQLDLDLEELRMEA